MKKRNRISRGLAGLIAAGTMCASLPSVTFAAQSLTGDVNLDSKVSTADVVALQQYLLNRLKLNADVLKNADMNADGAVNVFDLALLKKHLITDPVSNAVYIHLKGTSVTTEGDTAKAVQISGTTAKITASGTYYVDGTLTDGQILIETAAEDVEDVEIVLNDVTMTNSTKPCIYTSANTGSDKTKLTVNGTNTLTDTSATAYTESGVIFSNNKLTITKNSTGTLNILSSMNAAINGEKKINLNGGTIVINTADATNDAVAEASADGIKSDKNIEIEGAAVEIKSSGDGIKSDSGVYIYDGTISIKAGNDAVQAGTEIAVSGGNVAASGDRGFRLGIGGLLNITGGTVVATATDYQVNGNEEIDMSGSTQTIMLLDMAEEWKKDSAITIGDTTFAAKKKYDYVLISDASLKSNGEYKAAIGGASAKHSGGTSFKNTGIVTEFKGVTVTGDTPSVTSANAIVFGSNSVKLYDAAGAEASSLDGIKVNGSTVTITAGGEYTVSGTCANGQLIVDTADELVEVALAGVTLSNSSVAPIYVANVGDECTLSVKSGTINTISDGTSHTDSYVNSDNETVSVNGAIFSRSDLKIKGKGTLTVNGNTADGIVSKDDLKIWNGTIVVNAVDDGIRGNDSVRIGDPDDTEYPDLNVTVKTTSGDGIKTTSTETGKGYITISGGTIDITSNADGFQAEQDFTMNGGNVSIQTYTGSSFTGSGSSSGGNTNPWGGGGFGPGGGGFGTDGNPNKTDISAKGIKSAASIHINGGSLEVDSSDDALHAAKELNVLGGKLKISTADDALHSDETLNVGTEKGTFDSVEIYIPKCYEGVEAATINQNAGTVYIVSDDDGYNAAGGSDNSGNANPNPWGGGGMSSSSGTMNLKGGIVVVNSASGDHDAFDSNGGINITGGFFIANGQEPVDADGTISNNGGNIITMTSGNTNLNTTYVFKDSSGKVIASAVSASGGSYKYSSGSYTAVSGATISGGKNLSTLGQSAIYADGTASGGTELTAGSGGNTNPWGGR